MARIQGVVEQYFMLGISVLLMILTYYIYKSGKSVHQHTAVINKASPPTSGKTILVTGAAGFIGHATCLALKKEHPDNVIIGIDDFNDYYDVRLKIDRAYDLHKEGITVYNEDVCTIDFIEELFAMYNFTHVAHLAAQAGVRYSLENPQAYIHSNIECQLSIMNVLKNYPSVKLAYASSSSVYGKESAIPFILSAHTDRPGNMYAATKKTDELLGYHYCERYHMSSVGLRFFTVYGPWGRPDMAVYKFAEAIVEGKQVPMYHVSDDNPLGRDFTYVDDIVSGVLASLNYQPMQCGEKFNLGYGNPVSVPELIQYLQDELEIQANVEKLPLPPTEILRTWADIKTSTVHLGFQPKTNLRNGVRKFVQWYKDYRNKRKSEAESKSTPPQDSWFSQLYKDRINRHQKYTDNYDSKVAERRQHEIQVERNRFRKWFHSHHLDLPEVKKHTYVHYTGVESPGGNIIHLPKLAGDIQKLQSACNEYEQCVGFTSEGWLKHNITGEASWVKRTDTLTMHVADVDVCELGLSQCCTYATCIPTASAPAQYTCTCRPGYHGDGFSCLPLLGEVSHVEYEHLSDLYSVYNVSQMKAKADVYFFQGVDSPSGGYQMVKAGTVSNEDLPNVCRRDPLCVGITTSGVMKMRIMSPDHWTKTSAANNKQGIYIFDIDYCSLSDTRCPPHSRCGRVGPANYKCLCDDNSIAANDACWLKPPIRSQLIAQLTNEHQHDNNGEAQHAHDIDVGHPVKVQ